MNAKSINRSTQFLALMLWIFGLLTIDWSGSQAATPRAAMPATESALETPGQYWPTLGWRISTPEEQGMDSQKLRLMLDSVQQRKLNLYSFLVIRHGYIVSETYFAPTMPDTRREIYSCTKSVIATLVGIAIDKGYIDGVDQRVLDFFPGRVFENRDARKEKMTLDDLLTMRTGLDWHEDDPTIRAMYQSRDWVKFVMDEAMKEPPGSKFTYCTGCSHVLSAIIQQTTGTNTKAFAEKNLFEPLGISGVAWMTDSSGIPSGGWGIQMTPRDMAKLGYLYLRQGNWDGRQIVPAAWIKAATQKHTGTDSKLGYGYQWWIYPALDAYTALGRYGQTIFVIPRLDLIIVTTASINNHDPLFELFEKYIVLAVQKQ